MLTYVLFFQMEIWCLPFMVLFATLFRIMAHGDSQSILWVDIFTSVDSDYTAQLAFGRTVTTFTPGYNASHIGYYDIPRFPGLSYCTEPIIPVLGGFALHFFIDGEEDDPTLDINITPIALTAQSGYYQSLAISPFMFAFRSNDGAVEAYEPHTSRPLNYRPYFSPDTCKVLGPLLTRRWQYSIAEFSGLLICAQTL